MEVRSVVCRSKWHTMDVFSAHDRSRISVFCAIGSQLHQERSSLFFRASVTYSVLDEANLSYKSARFGSLLLLQ